MTLDQKLSSLANPSIGFIQNIRIAESAFAGLTFANGCVVTPPAAAGSGLGELPPMPVSGTGMGRIEALRRLMMEAVERNSSLYLGSEDLVRTYAGDASGVPLRELLVDASIDPGQMIRMVSAKPIIGGNRRLIPAACVYMGYSAGDEPCYFVADSNGCAAAETKEDAVRRALLEVIERDAFAIWWFNRVARPALSFTDDSMLCEIATALRTEERTLVLMNITNDIGVPVVAAYSADAKGSRIYLGCAADACETVSYTHLTLPTNREV